MLKKKRRRGRDRIRKARSPPRFRCSGVRETKRFSCWSAQRVAKEYNRTTQSHLDALNENSMVLSVSHIVCLYPSFLVSALAGGILLGAHQGTNYHVYAYIQEKELISTL